VQHAVSIRQRPHPSSRTREGASLGEKGNYLLSRDRIMQERLADVKERIDGLPALWRADKQAKKSRR